uniref:Secreted protein n=1 Tax=Setaria viridis TaxID=4556 RepID=A0A4U6U973_SETVI|nr:hypothetical protein SEVIR_6G246250v2 [Setaria viridis]
MTSWCLVGWVAVLVVVGRGPDRRKEKGGDVNWYSSARGACGCGHVVWSLVSPRVTRWPRRQASP